MQFSSHPVRLFASFAFVLVLSLFSPRDRAVFADAAVVRSEAGGVYVLENSHLTREFAVIDGTLRTSAIVNKLDGTRLSPIRCGEFRLRLSKDPDLEVGDIVLTAADFTCASVETLRHERGVEAVFSLVAIEHSLTVELHCLLGDEDSFSRKYLVLTSETEWALERVDVEFMEIPNIYQPYQIKAITARAPGQWKPGLGQPLYTRESGTFWGVEFPASDNRVDGNLLRCGYLHGRRLTPRKPYTSHRSVVGVSDSAEFVKDAFFEYIDRIRIRPLRLQIQYNSWFDHGGRVSADLFGKSVAYIDRKLVRERGLDPLSAYVIDDGWQDTAADWSVDLWKVNDKFDSKFERSRAAVDSAGSTLGLWLSPGCLFGAQGAIGSLKAAGFESIDPWMSMAGPKYMGAFEDRMAGLTRDGVAYFKLDGLFGHLNIRNFELRGGAYGLPEMPWLVPADMKGSDARLNEQKYDELKSYYLAAGTERLMRVFQSMARVNPEVYIVISNGAYLSPWWLQHVDSVWMINAGDAAGGSSRTEELVYRDDRYHELAVVEETQFPLCALFNHEPKKTRGKETKETFRRYLYMNLSRGTGFIELYIKPFVLAEYDWDVLAEGLLWAREVFPVFKRARMHGGSPKEGAVYGYTAWNEEQGYVSLHNPSGEPKAYEFTLDRSFGLSRQSVDQSRAFCLSSPLEGDTGGLQARYEAGQTLSVTLAPRGIRILNFSIAPRDWARLKELQRRTSDDYLPAEPVPVAGHPVLGSWHYLAAGRPHTRTFTADGFCVLRDEDAVQWRKPFTVESPTEIVVEDTYVHRIHPDGSMTIEDRYHATRK